MPKPLLLLLLTVCAAAGVAKVSAQSASCVSASSATPSQNGDCTGLIFTWGFSIQYSDGSTQSRTFTSSPAAGVCAVTYPGCSSSSTFPVNQQLPTVSQAVLNLNVNTQSMHFHYDINQFGVQETGTCACDSDDPAGFSFISPSGPPDVIGDDDASC
jgi:hypothetical protein